MGTKERADASELRKRAEERLRTREREGSPQVLKADALRLLHELEVYQIELELQNDELRTARDKVDAALAKYTELFDFAPIGYVTLGVDETIQQSNHAAARILGKERANLVGREFRAFIEVQHRAAFGALLVRALHSDTRETCEVQLARPAQPPIYLRVGATMLTHFASTTILLAFEDITESKVRERQLAAAELALREAHQRKDDFLSTLSHELRNPLAPIRNSLYVLGRVGPGTVQAQKALAVIDRQVSHLTRLVDDLLDVTRIMRGKIELKRECVELGDLVRRTLEDHRSGFEASGIDVEGRFEEGPTWVKGDATRLTQVLTNLLVNAEKFTLPGGTVVVCLLRVGPKASLEVRDTGIGITSEVQAYLFEPFAQAPQAMDRSRGGLGLGLAMVKGLVELHGGQVSIWSAGADRGTTVTVLLPLAEEASTLQRS